MKFGNLLLGCALVASSSLASGESNSKRDLRKPYTVRLKPTPDSTFQATWMSLTEFENAVRRIDGQFPASSSGPRSVRFLVDRQALTYTALIEQTSVEDLATLEAAKESLSTAQSGGARLRPQTSEFPPDECCDEMCSGQHSAILSTEDLFGILLASTIHTSAWDVYEGYLGRCRWESYGLGNCKIEPNNITHWYETGYQGSYPEGAYKLVSHWSSCQFQNYDWGNDEYPTGTGHWVQIYRSAGTPATQVHFSHWKDGEDAFLLGFRTTDNGENSCE